MTRTATHLVALMGAAACFGAGMAFGLTLALLYLCK